MKFAYIIVLYLLVIKCEDDIDEYCVKLSQKSLSFILGQAYNPRYMSIEPPGGMGVQYQTIGPGQADSSYNGNKRASQDLPFYADGDIVTLGDFPAWETDHLSYIKEADEEGRKHSRTKRAQEKDDGAFLKRAATYADIFKSRPWECSSKIRWIDLGAHYFPRYIRSLECISKKCWYGHFNCKPKSFSIKVLRRKSNSCIRINKKLIMISDDSFDKEFAELWIWEEILVNFCCDCMMIY